MMPGEALGWFVAARFGVRRLCAACGRGGPEKRHGTGALQNLRNPGYFSCLLLASPSASGAVLRDGGAFLAHRQPVFAVQFVSVEQPCRLLRRQRHLLTLSALSLLSAMLLFIRHVLLLILRYSSPR